MSEKPILCPRCHQSTEQDGIWPIDFEGDIVDGCYRCFEDDADAMWNTHIFGPTAPVEI